jgi:cell surface protein SprA
MTSHASAKELAADDAGSDYWHGYETSSQEVVIPSFYAAYTGKDASKVKLNPFKIIPMPNWDITYDGLSKLELFKKYFRTFTLNHSYRSSFNLGSYQSNLLYDPEGAVTDAAGNFIPARQITVVTITEAMRPLINFDATLQNSLLAKFEYNRDRAVSLSLSNQQVTEVRGVEYVIGSGYRFKNVKFPFAIGNSKPKSDMNLRVDLSLRRNNTVIRSMQQLTNQVTAGQNIISIKTSADYVISQRLNVRAFYEKVINKPVISTSFYSSARRHRPAVPLRMNKANGMGSMEGDTFLVRLALFMPDVRSSTAKPATMPPSPRPGSILITRKLAFLIAI